MKIYKSSDLTNKRSEVFREAEENGVIIQQCRTNGEVIGELVLTKKQQVNYDYEKLKGALALMFNVPSLTPAEYGQLIKLTRKG